MTQVAVVKSLIDETRAEVCVTRRSACGGNCSNCDGCSNTNDIIVEADNAVQAKPGQTVLISTDSRKVFGSILVVYLIPIVLFILGYIIPCLLGIGESACIAVSFLTLIISACLIFIRNRKVTAKGGVSYTILKVSEDV